MRKLFLALSIVTSTISFSQTENKYTENNNSLTKWAEQMYSDNPDIGEVMKLYEAYYSSHTFQKNSHTQYYKRWLKEAQRTQKEVKNPAQKTAEQNYLNTKQKNSKASNSQWQGIGPFDYDEDIPDMSYAAGASHVYTVEQSISNTNVLYAGTATAGMWKSTDKGLNWYLISRDLILTGVYAIEIDPSNDNIVYMGASDGRLWKTMDGGTSWNSINSSDFYEGSGRVQDIVLSPNNNNLLFVLTKDGFYRSVNAGVSFSKIASGEYQEIEFHPTTPTTIYTIKYNSSTLRTEFYKSTDNGLSFNLKSTGWPSSGEQKRSEIAVTTDNPNAVYAYCSGSVNGGSGTYGLYKSSNSGESWSFNCCGPQPGGAPSASNKNLMGWSDEGTDDGGQYYYDLAFAVLPSNDQKVLVGAVNLWHSDNGGQDFYCPSKWSHSYKDDYVHADIHDIKIYGNDIWLASDGGIWYSNDGGTTFNKRFKGIQGTDFWGFGMGYGEKGHRVMVGGAYHNGTQLRDNDVYREGWAVVHGGDGEGGHVSPFNDRIYNGQNGTFSLPGSRTGALVSASFSKNPNNDYPLGKASAVKYHPRNYNTVFVGEGNTLWKSTNNGVSFSLLKDFGAHITDFEISDVNPDIIYAATYIDYWGAKKLYRTINAGASWTEITLPSNLDIKTAAPYDITLSATDENTIWVAKLAHYGSFSYELDGFKAFKSTDKGSNWINLTTSTLDDEKIQTIVHQAGTNGGVYLGTGRAVYYRNNSMTDWALFNNNLPKATSSLKVMPDYYTGKIVNASGRGVFEADFYESSDPIARFGASSFTTTCNTGDITFIDQSVVSSSSLLRNWTFEGGITSSTSNDKVVVSYPLPGVYDVSLTITDINGTHTVTYTDFITITGSCTSSLDLAIDQFENIPSSVDCINSDFTPSVKLINKGTVEISSYTAKIYVNGILINTMNETTSLSTGASESINLGFIENIFSLKVILENVNGTSDDNLSNNTLIQSFDYPELANTNYSTVSVSSEQPNTFALSIDNDINTIWHSRWSTGNDPLPHVLVYDLGTELFVTKMNMTNRQDNSNGYLGEVEVFVSQDGTNWGLSTTGLFVSTKGKQTLALSGQKGRYVKLQINTTLSGDRVASIAELSFEGCDNLVTDIVITHQPIISVYPNPVQGELIIEGINSESTITIVNLLGETVFERSILSNQKIAMGQLHNGLYTIKIQNDLSTETFKIVKQ